MKPATSLCFWRTSVGTSRCTGRETRRGRQPRIGKGIEYPRPDGREAPKGSAGGKLLSVGQAPENAPSVSRSNRLHRHSHSWSAGVVGSEDGCKRRGGADWEPVRKRTHKGVTR